MNSKHKDRPDIKPPKTDKPRVLVDLDGVVRDFVGSLIRVYRQYYPEHEVLPVNSRELEKFFPAGREIYKFLAQGNMKRIMLEASPISGAIEDLHKWSGEFEIVIVTSQKEMGRAATFSWIGNHNLPTNEVHITYYKSEIEGLALLDDFSDNLKEFASTGRLAVCYDQPWNQDWQGRRVKSVNGFFELVQEEIFKYNREYGENKFLT